MAMMSGLEIKEPRSAEGALAKTTLLATIGLISGVLGGTALIFGAVLYAIDPGVVGLTILNAAIGIVGIAFYAATNWRTLTRAFSGRSTSLVVLEAVIVLGVIGLLITANYFAAQSKVEWDLTHDKLFTLQEQSIKVAAGLTKKIKIVGFFRPSDAQRAALRDLVDLYRKESDQISLEFINPDAAPPSLVKEYQMSANSPRIVLVNEAKQLAKVKLPTEEALTNALLKLGERAQRKVYFLSGHGEPSIEDDQSEGGYQRPASALKDEGYAVAALSLLDKDAVPKDASVVVIAAAEKALFPNEVGALKSWLDRGGRLVALLEPGVESGLGKIFDAYAIEVGDNLVVEPNPASRAFGFGPDAPVVTKFEQHPITDPLRGSAALFYWVRSVSPRVGATKVRTTTLIQTGPLSWGETRYKEGGDVSRDEDDVPGPVPIAVAATMDTLGVENRASDQARLVVFGDSSFANNRFLSMSGNSDLFINALNWAAGDEDKISLRPKARGASRIPLTESQQYGIMFFSVNLLPLLIVGVGFSIWAVRRRK